MCLSNPEGTDVTDVLAGAEPDQSACALIRSTLTRVGEKWSALVLDELRDGPCRFNELKRSMTPITQRMLTATLRGLEHDGLISRTAYPTIPPQVEYALTDAGRDLLIVIKDIARWADAHLDQLTAARADFTGGRR
jgi:DNA-binding HxlR family transcriptional regulator